MPATCPKCQSTDIRRKRREGVVAQMRSAVGCWPYFCAACCKSFYLRQRSVETVEEFAYEAPVACGSRTETGARAAYRAETAKPHAKIVLQAETQGQLESMLLALSRVVAEHQNASRQGCAA